MTVLLDGEPHTTELASPARHAEWPARALAFVIDVLLGLGLAGTLQFVGWSDQRLGALFWACMIPTAAVLVAVAANRWVLPGLVGNTLGRSVLGVTVTGRDGGPVSVGRLAARDAAHLLDTLPLLLGWLWPLVDSRGRTFADILTGTEAQVTDAGGTGPRRLATRIVAALTALAAVLAAVGYLAVYRPQAAAADTRDRIAREGPALVADLLSYTLKDADKDFAHDRELVTDGFRPQWAEQQEAARKAGLSDNEYWVTNTAVLSATGRDGTALMLLQGQRGTPPNQRFIIASVRAEFQKTAGGWKISGLTLLTPPKLPPPKTPAPTGPAPKQEKPAPQKPAPQSPAPQSPAPKSPAPVPGGGGR